MEKSIRSKNKTFKNLFIIILIFLFILLLLFYLFRKMNFKRILFPIYKIEDRTSSVDKAKKKYNNEKVVGWIKVQGTNIDYPIIEYSDTMMETFKSDGYVWVNVSPKNQDNFLTILGHNIRNVSSQPLVGDKTMNQFEQLMSFIYYDFSKENKYIQYTLNGKNRLYQIFSVSLIDKDDVDSSITSYTNKDLKKYIEESQKNSYFDFDIDIDVSDSDKIISLVTCTRFNGRSDLQFRVDAKLVKKNKGYDYDITENSNYKEIKEILKGVDDDYA